jgi:hypothetical protein
MENTENKQSPKQEKPPFLYHGSPHKIKELEPRTKPHREKEEGKLVYATSELTDAIMFLQKTALTGHFVVEGERVAYAVIVGNREKFIERDKGGHIHVLPSDTFETSPHRGMSNEWVSKEGVKPVEVIEHTSALDAMLENGVQVYFVDEATYQQIRRAEDHGYSILKSLESENQKRGVNVKL